MMFFFVQYSSLSKWTVLNTVLVQFKYNKIYMIFFIQVQHQTALRIFESCKGVVKNDSTMALYMLPHVVVQVLLDGSEDDAKEVMLL